MQIVIFQLAILLSACQALYSSTRVESHYNENGSLLKFRCSDLHTEFAVSEQLAKSLNDVTTGLTLAMVPHGALRVIGNNREKIHKILGENNSWRIRTKDETRVGKKILRNGTQLYPRFQSKLCNKLLEVSR